VGQFRQEIRASLVLFELLCHLAQDGGSDPDDLSGVYRRQQLPLKLPVFLVPICNDPFHKLVHSDPPPTRDLPRCLALRQTILSQSAGWNKEFQPVTPGRLNLGGTSDIDFFLGLKAEST
jgi:hypothetical protein